MTLLPSRLRQVFQTWRTESDLIEDAAAIANLRRMRLMCPTLGALNFLHVAIFLWLLQEPQTSLLSYQWKVGLVVTHACMGVLMLVFTIATFRVLRQPAPTAAARWLGQALFALGMLFAVAVATVDQWVTPNISPFLVSSIVSGVAIYTRPRVAAAVYLASYLAFFAAMRFIQHSPDLLASNLVNGIAVSITGLVLSVMLWRNFTTITLQQRELQTAHNELQRNHEELARLNRLDGLTGLYNRNTIVELTVLELERSHRLGGPTSILLFDLDLFKSINDRWGHPAGDAALKHVAALVLRTVRSTDVAGRLGGEEFMLLLPGTTDEAARKLAEKLRARLESNPVPWEGEAITVTASIGVAGTTPADRCSFDDLYAEADKALYQAKEQGRNRVV